MLSYNVYVLRRTAYMYNIIIPEASWSIIPMKLLPVSVLTAKKVSGPVCVQFNTRSVLPACWDCLTNLCWHHLILCVCNSMLITAMLIDDVVYLYAYNHQYLSWAWGEE